MSLLYFLLETDFFLTGPGKRTPVAFSGFREKFHFPDAVIYSIEFDQPVIHNYFLP
tara:strand:+ start:145 stop:312 length:168 start_codon:yes stop_codon:yes gene_type:complete